LATVTGHGYIESNKSNYQSKPPRESQSDSRRSFGLEIGFIDHFNTRLVTALNYSAIADIHNLQITTAHAKSFSQLSLVVSQ
jgi:hypothetical protein